MRMCFSSIAPMVWEKLHFSSSCTMFFQPLGKFGGFKKTLLILLLFSQCEKNMTAIAEFHQELGIPQ